jgi:nucleotide-binding universal stress UspA family protein
MMKALIAVDQSSHSDRALAKFFASNPSSNSRVRLCMIINPFMPPPMTSFVDGAGYFHFVMRNQSLNRLEQLAETLRVRDLAVEIDLVETRMPEFFAITLRALQWKADKLVVGLHSFLGIKRFLLQLVFGWINGRRTKDPGINSPGNCPGSNTSLQNNRRAA